MFKLNQSSSILIIITLIYLVYFILLNYHLITKTQILNSICLNQPSINTNLCASCFKRKQLTIVNLGNIFIWDQ
jgi:hypothetical protein